MIPHYTDLQEEDLSLLLDAIPLITVYVAGADGEIKEGEVSWAEKLTKISQFDYSTAMTQYYEMVDERFMERITAIRKDLPGDVEARKEAIEASLSKLNSVLSKMETHTANKFIKSFRTFAKHVARSSGGFFGFGAISEEEARLIKLDMFTPIEGKL